VSEVIDGLRGIGLNGHSERSFSGSFGHVTPHDIRPEAFAAALAELAFSIDREGSTDKQHALTVITDGAVTLIDGAEQSAVVVPCGLGRLDAKAVHGDLPPLLMGLQNDVGEGPCLEAVAQTSQVVVSEVSTETRWPLFSARVTSLGVGSMLCTPLAAHDRILGSLSLISSRPRAFDQEAAGLAAVFATHAALALVGVEEVRNLKAMASSRDLIGQAKGILMERYKLSAEKAFSVLVRTSQDNNIKLRALCDQLINTGKLPI